MGQADPAVGREVVAPEGAGSEGAGPQHKEGGGEQPVLGRGIKGRRLRLREGQHRIGTEAVGGDGLEPAGVAAADDQHAVAAQVPLQVLIGREAGGGAAAGGEAGGSGGGAGGEGASHPACPRPEGPRQGRGGHLHPAVLCRVVEEGGGIGLHQQLLLAVMPAGDDEVAGGSSAGRGGAELPALEIEDLAVAVADGHLNSPQLTVMLRRRESAERCIRAGI